MGVVQWSFPFDTPDVRILPRCLIDASRNRVGSSQRICIPILILILILPLHVHLHPDLPLLLAATYDFQNGAEQKGG